MVVSKALWMANVVNIQSRKVVHLVSFDKIQWGFLNVVKMSSREGTVCISILSKQYMFTFICTFVSVVKYSDDRSSLSLSDMLNCSGACFLFNEHCQHSQVNSEYI